MLGCVYDVHVLQQYPKAGPISIIIKLFDERSVVDEYRCHMATNFSLLDAEKHDKFPTLLIYYLSEP